MTILSTIFQILGVLFFLMICGIVFGLWLVGWGDRHYKTMNKKEYEKEMKE